jgi:crotonobetaine/carnitine-CoA ligase
MTTLPQLLRRRAEETPDRTFLVDVAGPARTFAQVEADVLSWMGLLRATGVVAGDRVGVMLPPSIDAAELWLAIARLGAIETPINTGYRGAFLGRVLADAEPRCVVTDERYAGRFADLDGQPVRLVLTSTPRPAADGDPGIDPAPHDIATLLYTSGTSGRSKGVLVPWGQLHATGLWTMPVDGRDEDDAWYGPWPLFHISGKLGLYNAALTGGRLILRETFSTSRFWDDVRTHGATSTLLVASTVTFLASQPAADDDADSPLCNVFASPMPSDPEAFAKRFGVRICTAFNMTEVASPITTGWTPVPAGSCGTVRPGASCRLVDEQGYDVPDGTRGELVIRMDRPHDILAGYRHAPLATVDAWRDLWFHTGDLLRRDAQGYYYFIDRLKDTIRVGGENVSSHELETEAISHPAVKDAAAVGVPAPWGEHEIKLFVVVEDDQKLDGAELVAYLEPRLPAFMLPRYVVFLDEIPKTHTHRAEKYRLRDLDLPDRTWTRPRPVRRAAEPSA